MSEQQGSKLVRHELEEMLLTHADELARGKHSDAAIKDAVPEELGLLFVLSDQLNATLHPIQPSSEYVAALKNRLADGWILTMSQKDRLIQVFGTLAVVFSILTAVALATRVLGLVIAALTQTQRGGTAAT